METCSGDDNNNNTFVKIDCVMKNHVIDEHKEYLSKHYDINLNSKTEALPQCTGSLTCTKFRLVYYRILLLHLTI